MRCRRLRKFDSERRILHRLLGAFGSSSVLVCYWRGLSWWTRCWHLRGFRFWSPSSREFKSLMKRKHLRRLERWLHCGRQSLRSRFCCGSRRWFLRLCWRRFCCRGKGRFRRRPLGWLIGRCRRGLANRKTCRYLRRPWRWHVEVLMCDDDDEDGDDDDTYYGYIQQ